MTCLHPELDRIENPRELAHRLHQTAVATPGLPEGLAAALASWRPGSAGALRVGVLGAPGTGRTTLVAAVKAALGEELPLGLVLTEGPALPPGPVDTTTVQWASELDAVILLKALRQPLFDADRELLAALRVWGTPVRVVVGQVDLEQPVVVGGHVRQGARARVGQHLATLAAELEQLGVKAEPVPASMTPDSGAQGLAALVGLLWAWSASREHFHALRDLRQLARMLDAMAAAARPLGRWSSLAAPSGAAPALGGGRHHTGPFEELAQRAWDCLAGREPFDARSEAAQALVPLLAAFAESGFATAFLDAARTACEGRDPASLLLAGDRPTSLRLAGLLHHDLDAVHLEATLPTSAWVVAGRCPAWVPSHEVVSLPCPEHLPALVLPPAHMPPGTLEALPGVADLLVIHQDPRLPRPAATLPTMYAFGDAATIAPAALVRLARAAEEQAWFLHDGHDRRYNDLWRLARAGGPFWAGWQTAGLGLDAPFTEAALQRLDETFPTPDPLPQEAA